MKKLLCLATLLVFAFAATSSANPVLTLDETFQSGATFSGALTFLPDYSNLVAVDGWLTGGPYGNDHLTWIWDPTQNFAASYGPQYGGNFLMDGTTCGRSCGVYTYFITITWDFSGAPNLVLATPGPILDSRGGNNVNYTDPLVSGSFGSPVPEPASMLLVGTGLVGFARAWRKRRQ